MIRTLRTYFLTRLLREKILLLGFIVIGLLWWASAFSTRAGAFWRQQRSTTATLTEQQIWLDNQASIENAARKAAAQLDPSKTLDGTRLIAAVNQAAYDAGLRNNYNANPATHETNGQFTVHSAEHTVNGADYETLEKFYLNLHQRAPYVGIERFSLAANRNDPAKLTLNLRVSSVEIPR